MSILEACKSNICFFGKTGQVKKDLTFFSYMGPLKLGDFEQLNLRLQYAKKSPPPHIIETNSPVNSKQIRIERAISYLF